MEYMNIINESAYAIRKVCGEAEIAIILGSGLGDYAKSLKEAKSIEYTNIPGFPVSTVPGHAGVWHTGILSGKKVIMMQGRFHSYEGYPMETVTLPIRVMKKLGVNTLIVTNAAGGVNTGFKPGNLMIINDFINFSGKNPLIGHNLDEFGPRFPDMSYALDKSLIDLTRNIAKEINVDVKEGIYAWFNGPSFETPAEIRMARILGADAVGMSTVPEIIVANHSGIKCLGISCITNMAAGILDQPLNHQEVMDTGKQAQNDFRQLIDNVVKNL